MPSRSVAGFSVRSSSPTSTRIPVPSMRIAINKGLHHRRWSSTRTTIYNAAAKWAILSRVDVRIVRTAAARWTIPLISSHNAGDAPVAARN
jgi:hypothetical protein